MVYNAVQSLMEIISMNIEKLKKIKVSVHVSSDKIYICVTVETPPKKRKSFGRVTQRFPEKKQSWRKEILS